MADTSIIPPREEKRGDGTAYTKGTEPINPHLPPPAYIKAAHKALQHSTSSPISTWTLSSSPFSVHSTIPASTLSAAFTTFSPSTVLTTSLKDVPVYTPVSHPGLFILPSLLPPEIQLSLLNSLLITHLSSTDTNRTNLHLHYSLPPPPFSLLTAPDNHHLQPIDPSVHKPLMAHRARERKLRWMTLGGQYDWTNKRYPRAGETNHGEPTDLTEAEKAAAPLFPPDLSALISTLWPDIIPQAAIVNVYSPGDTLAPHRDVAESSNAGLVSISIGCDGVFMIARPEQSGEIKKDGEHEGAQGKEDGILSLRLHSGDVVVMSAEMRRAWHSVPKIIAGTCPEEIGEWPGEEGGGIARGWVKGKRVNFNVRQMWDS
ncbi:hypothetical protein EX30DRAFT_338932 [Ascodesmis nigricans]|uniref:Fe2OG dioxygenase domain-containing protein n=1 Tax=Ascodesmis nigricans TaxID=341454 RepID=A0A4V3SJK6_9PEZI|nr:hypothetical protein EX30DRAFT_338932 [Ascodesmis nigricans]